VSFVRGVQRGVHRLRRPAQWWVKVENIDGLACVPYELQYHF